MRHGGASMVYNKTGDISLVMQQLEVTDQNTALIYAKSQRIRFVFYDNGIGIKSHMTRIPYALMHKAFKDLVSLDTLGPTCKCCDWCSGKIYCFCN